MKGAVASGHRLTTEAACLMLEAGGNAFDAVLAGLCAASVVEPVLTSLAGGGFLTAHTSDGTTRVYDFFVQSPARKRPLADIDFHPVLLDFGTAQQEFHIGLGSVATPGTVRGLFQIHRELATLPLSEIFAPAIHYARDGIRLNEQQAYIFSIVAPIYLATDEARSVYSGAEHGVICGQDEVMRQPELANSFELFDREGERLFYDGEMAAAMVDLVEQGGGHLQRRDLHNYRSLHRQPLGHRYRDADIWTNPPPSSGGILIAFALQLLAAQQSVAEFGSVAHLTRLVAVLDQTNAARARHLLDAGLLDPELTARYRAAVDEHPVCNRGTTHISVVDSEGNAAALTLSNGEGCGHLIPGTGIMLNNMLGEEDLNPDGFHRWQPDRRVSSMMAPTVVRRGDTLISIGSGGSNRLRTAILQTLCNMIDFGMSAGDAVNSPRIHIERDHASLEPGFSTEAVRLVQAAYPSHHLWSERNLFFGGTHTVVSTAGGFSGAGDPRRDGDFRIAGNSAASGR